tara:strand:+ start:720 stop:1262 length:543 start_codon:yes stop_codon:yes gene_type:complete
LSQGVIARRYAKALINLAEKEDLLESTGLNLSNLAKVFKESSELNEIITDTKVSTIVKKEVLKEVLAKINAPTLIDKFVRFIFFKRRILLIQDIEKAFNLYLQEKLGRIEAKVTVPYELPKEDVKKLEKSISKFSGKEASVCVNVDPSIIGGIVTRIGSVVIDGSINTQLNQIRQSIIRG